MKYADTIIDNSNKQDFRNNNSKQNKESCFGSSICIVSGKETLT